MSLMGASLRHNCQFDGLRFSPNSDGDNREAGVADLLGILETAGASARQNGPQPYAGPGGQPAARLSPGCFSS